jgi:phosphoribosylanthranilate isomerase
MTRGLIKICGITRLSDARHAVRAGATALGFVFWAESPRSITPAEAGEIIQAIEAPVTTVGVFVNESVDVIRAVVEETGIQAVQLHGDEPPSYARQLNLPLLRSARVDTALETARAWPAETTLLLDAADPVRRGGTGIRVDWPGAASVARLHRVVLAGGLTPVNVAEAIAAVRPAGVDVSSGVEASPGIKDLDKVSRFLANAREAFERL